MVTEKFLEWFDRGWDKWELWYKRKKEVKERKREEKEEFYDGSPVIGGEKDRPVRLSVGFKILLGTAIFLSGFLVSTYLQRMLSAPWSEIFGDSEMLVEYSQKLLYCIILSLCFLMLVSIAISKRPFNSVLYGFGIAASIVILVASFLFPRIDGYYTNFRILSKGYRCVFDGNYFIPGLLALVMALLLRYGYKYQNNSDMTV